MVSVQLRHEARERMGTPKNGNCHPQKNPLPQRYNRGRRLQAVGVTWEKFRNPQ